ASVVHMSPVAAASGQITAMTYADPSTLIQSFDRFGAPTSSSPIALSVRRGAFQRDGALVYSELQADGVVHLRRVGPDGREDATFGEVIVGFGAHKYFAGAMAVQPDGKIVVASEVLEASAANRHTAIARVLPDGQPDTTFGTGGVLEPGDTLLGEPTQIKI